MRTYDLVKARYRQLKVSLLSAPSLGDDLWRIIVKLIHVRRMYEIESVLRVPHAQCTQTDTHRHNSKKGKTWKKDYIIKSH